MAELMQSNFGFDILNPINSLQMMLLQHSQILATEDVCQDLSQVEASYAFTEK